MRTFIALIFGWIAGGYVGFCWETYPFLLHIIVTFFMGFGVTLLLLNILPRNMGKNF